METIFLKVNRRTRAGQDHHNWLQQPRVRALATVDPAFRRAALAATTPEARSAFDERLSRHNGASMFHDVCRCGCRMDFRGGGDGVRMPSAAKS